VSQRRASPMRPLRPGPPRTSRTFQTSPLPRGDNNTSSAARRPRRGVSASKFLDHLPPRTRHATSAGDQPYRPVVVRPNVASLSPCPRGPTVATRTLRRAEAIATSALCKDCTTQILCLAAGCRASRDRADRSLLRRPAGAPAVRCGNGQRNHAIYTAAVTRSATRDRGSGLLRPRDAHRHAAPVRAVRGETHDQRRPSGRLRADATCRPRRSGSCGAA
jgi:hypothetical protein